jgi:hypothetical protein
MLAIARPVAKDSTDPSHTTFKWGKEIVDYALHHGVNALDITDPWVEYHKITYLLKKHRPDMFVYTGHGCKNYLSVQNGCSITNGHLEDVCQSQCNLPPNLSILKGAIVVVFSCHSSSQEGSVGKCAIRYGARAYVGFSDYMMFTSDRLGSENLFKEKLLPLAIEILNGKTVGEAVQITKDALITAAKKWKSVKYLSIPMMWNAEYMQVLGDMNARLGS